MKIAQIAPLYEAVPPKLYGGTEMVMAHLCDALVDLGHDVTLFASADSSTRARLVPMRDQSLRLDAAALKSDVGAHLRMLEEVRAVCQRFDILHFHVELLHLPMFEHVAHRSVTTVHSRTDLKDLPGTYARWPHYGLVSISHQQRKPLPEANWLGTVHHGISPDRYWSSASGEHRYLAFLGRIAPEKGPDTAIRVARQAGIPLRIAAKVDPADRVYFETVIRPMLDDPLIEFIGEIDARQKPEFLANALALLFPIRWPEPFGLVMIEAMACGTPVIAWDGGSVPEIIEPGRTGFVVRSDREALRAIDRVGHLDRRAVREAFGRRFTARHMAEAYLDVYQALLEAPRAVAQGRHGRRATYGTRLGQ
ncbi:MAG TPA: glycosyltransferase family 4 protein [Steroidobacteraceae bacterium]|nr:glycosyltransferase family 4 protein [Steroidobacteraceae bacterium]